MTSKDDYVVMNVAENLVEIAQTLKNVLGDTEIIQELFANIKLLYSTETMKKTFNKVITDIAAGKDTSVDVIDLADSDDAYWVSDNKEPAKSYNQVNDARKKKKRKKKEKSV